ncbi:MAG: endonuclease/exonuclease/phosphatase family protein [Micropruina sp.]|uniref:endonuclease/exonuclease/phosphatase family protein n=1 Tax=Micropruina sp. TaxID=2737536 RepID=UPI0039E5BE0C
MTSPPPSAAAPSPLAPPARRRVRGQAWLVVFGLLLAVPAVAATGLRVLAPSSDQLAKVASFIPYGLVFWLPATILVGVATLRAWRGRTPGRWPVSVLSALCAAGLAATAVWQAPVFFSDSRPVDTAPLTVASLNVAGEADPAVAARAVADADVVVFVEAHVKWVSTLPDSFRAAFRYRAPVDAKASDRANADAVIFSKHPIISSEPMPPSSFQQWTALIRTPQLGPLRVVAAHPCNPYCRPGLWSREAQRLRSWLAARDASVPTVVAGDFNSVDDHPTMQALYADGFRSAADLAGAGFVRTWPADRRFPPLIAIDHVLVDDRLTATSLSTFDVPGTDHLGLRAVIAGTGKQ